MTRIVVSCSLGGIQVFHGCAKAITTAMIIAWTATLQSLSGQLSGGFGANGIGVTRGVFTCLSS